jgi:hypothetical protein
MKVLPFQYYAYLDMGDPTFKELEARNVFIEVAERDGFAWTFQTETYWIEQSAGVEVLAETSASISDSTRLYGMADASGWATESSPYYQFFRWGVGNSESYITPIEIDLDDNTIQDWSYNGDNLPFYIGEKKNVWIGGSERSGNNFTIQSVTHWVQDTHGVTFVTKTDGGNTTIGYRISSLIDSTGWSTASDPYTLFVEFHLWETPLETFVKEIKMDAENLE